MRYSLLLLPLIISALIACSSAGKPASQEEQLAASIDSLEGILFSNSEAKTDIKAGMLLVRKYATFYKLNPTDSIAVDRLFKAAEVSMGIGQGNLAVKYFRTISDEHADFHKAPEALFLSGFCSENLNNDIEQAKFFYEQFIKKHPDHKLAQDAKFSIQNLGKSDEELIKMFEENLKSKSE
jgi:hypothetical protein